IEAGNRCSEFAVGLVKASRHLRDLQKRLFSLAESLLPRLPKAEEISGPISRLQIGLRIIRQTVKESQQSLDFLQCGLRLAVLLSIRLQARSQERRHQQQCFELILSSARRAVCIESCRKSLFGCWLRVPPAIGQLQPSAETASVEGYELLIQIN